MRKTLILAAIGALAFASAADAKVCRDRHGHFVKCPGPAVSPRNRVLIPRAGAMRCRAHTKACGHVCIPWGHVCHVR